MNVIDKAIELFPGTTLADWRLEGKSAVHSSVKPSKACRFLGPAIVRGGELRGGVFSGGVFEGGVFSGGFFSDGVFEGGVFSGGEFRGGLFRGGVFSGGWFLSGLFYGGLFYGSWFYGGEFRDGLFYDGVFRGGVFRGGVFRGGVFSGGEFRGGEFRGGVFKQPPSVVLGVLPWPVTRQGEGDDRIAVGCECHSLDEWERNIDAIADEHGMLEKTKAKVLQAVRLVSEN